ncbi:MAG: RNA-binding protein [Ruminococcaceae bacterium]|nr:RNA-binding protein [Oscillospiraceae bacterium]
MDKNSLVNKYARNDDEKVGFAHLFDLAERSQNRNIVTSGNFFSESESVSASAMLKEAGIDSFFYGGYENAERRCPVFLPDYYIKEDIINDPTLAEIKFLTYSVDSYFTDAALSHRDVLGSLMALGIERCTVGDIICNKGEGTIIVRETIAPFLVENLVKIGRYPVEIKSYDNLKIEKTEDFEEHFDTVASLRLDSVVASFFSLSRSTATDKITSGLVTVNGVVTVKNSALVKEGDRIALRGQGRAELEKIDGLSKKGRTRLLFKKYK